MVNQRRLHCLLAKRAIAGLALAMALLLVHPLVSIAQGTLTPPDVVIVTDKPADEGCIVLDECVQFVVTVTNPSRPPAGPDPTMYKVKVTVPIHPALDPIQASSTKGTAQIIGQTVVVNGGISLAAGESLIINITACPVVPGPLTITTNAYVEFEDGSGNPQAPADTTLEPAVVEICPVPTPFVPEASTLLLMGSAATGLTGYIGVQIRARRRRRH